MRFFFQKENVLFATIHYTKVKKIEETKSLSPTPLCFSLTCGVSCFTHTYIPSIHPFLYHHVNELQEQNTPFKTLCR